MKVIMLSHTPHPEQLVATAAKLCYSKVGVKELKKKLDAESTEKFLNRLAELGHESPLEHIAFTFGIEGISRSCSHQLVRHRMGSYCITGDTIIQSFCQKNRGAKKWTVEQLYNWQNDPKYSGKIKLINIRSADENTRILVKNKIKKIYSTGIQPVYEVLTKTGRRIKATANHSFYTPVGYRKLSELKKGDRVFANGLPALNNPEYLYQRYIIDNTPRKALAAEIGCGDSTLGKVLKKYNIVKPHSMYPNRQGGGNFHPFTDTHKKNLHNAMLKNKNHNWKSDYNELTISGGYTRSNRFFPKKVCWGCGSIENLENHHLDKNPKNNDESNILTLCQSCHKAFHHSNINTIFSDEIVSIIYIGEEKTYDIEVVNNPHNFVANGIVVHNSQQSQRYVNLDETFEYITPECIKANDVTREFYDACMNTIHTGYIALTENLKQRFISEGMDEKAAEKKAIENARYVLPNACETKLVVTMNARSLLNFFKLRCCNRAQDEIRAVADEMLKLCKKTAPLIFKYAGAPCMHGKCTEGKMSCGKPRKDEENA